MIPFFRKIRKSLSDQAQFVRYSRYAIGEIALVVIGILIALQINNWNESMKLRKVEVKLLEELRNDLHVTLDELKTDIPNLKAQMLLADRLIQYGSQEQDENYSPEKFLDSFGYFNWNVKMYPRTIAYQNLKALGFDLFTNDSIKYLTAEIFDRKLSRVKLWEDMVGEKGELLIQKMSEELVAYSYKDRGNHAGVRDVYLYAPERFEDLANSKSILNELANMQNDRVMQIELYKQLKSDVIGLIEMINQEIGIADMEISQN